MDGEHILNNHISPDEKKWERPWTTDEIRRNSANWTLAGDVGLFHLLNEFSHKLISRTHEVENEVDALVHKTKIASVKINNVINDFHMLSNLQFVENRVYDEEIQDNSAQEKHVQEKTKEQREAEMLPKVIQAIELGLSVLEQAFDKINVEEISDSEDEEDLSSEGRTILEPKDPYEYRSLPFIIGSKEFENDDFAGLRELCEEEAADVSAEDQTVSESESESSSSEEEEPLPLIDSTDSKFSGRTEDRMVAESISDKLSSSDESELFGSEKGDENEIFSELSLDAKKNQVNQALKANLENIERKDTRQSSISSMQSRLKLPQVLPSPKKEENFKEEKDLFSNEDEMSDDDSPFQKKSSLFKSEAKFANDDQDLLGDDLFGEKAKVQDVISPPPKLEKPIMQKETKTQSSAKEPRNSILFSTDDSEDDMFSTLTKAKPLVKAKAPEKSVKAPKATSQPVKKADKPFGFKENGSNSLFGDDSDADDLFAESKSQKKFGFESTEDDDLFGLINDKTPKVSKEKENILPSKTSKSDKEFSLFDDSGSFEQTEKFETKKPQTVTTTGKVPKLFDDSDGSEQETKEKTTRVAPITKAKKNDVLFSDSEGEIFKQEPSKTKSKPVIVDDDDFSLFDDSKTTVVQQNASVKVKSKEPASLFEDSDNFDLFSEKSTVKKDMPSNKATVPKQANIDTPDALFFDDSISRAEQDAKIKSLKTEVPSLKQTKDASPTVDLFDDSLPVSSKSEVPPLKQSKAASPTVDLFDDSLPVSSKPKITSNVDSSNNGGSTEISFDSPADISNTLNVLGKDRIKVSAKRRKPTRKGRLAALQTNDSNQTNSESKDLPITNIEQIMQSTAPEIASSPVKTTASHKEKEKQKMNLMSQLISEVATSKVRRIPVPTKEDNDDDDDEVDLFSTKPRAKTSSQSEFSFLSPVENSLSSTKMSLDTPEQNSEDKIEVASALSTENAENVDNDDFFAEPSFKGFRSSISHQNSVLDFDDDDDDDLFKSIKDPLPKLKSTPAVTNSNDIFSDDADDIFAGLQKEKYEMFPSQLYEEDGDEGDIFGSSEKPPTNKTTTSNASSKTNSSTLKKEPEKKPVDLFEDPLTGLLQE